VRLVRDPFQATRATRSGAQRFWSNDLIPKKLRTVLAAAACTVLAAGCASAAAATSDSTQHGSTTAAAPQKSKPNIVFVLTDDLAWNLVSHMPHVQAMEKAGTTLSHYYVVDSLCCPSRTAIFTGEYPHDDGVFTNTGPDGGYNTFQSHQDGKRTFAVALHNSGYRTAMMGKYLNGYLPTDPKGSGWDQWDVAGDGYPEFNYTLNENGKKVHYGSKAKDYLTNVLSGKASQFISSSAAKKKPFMLEVATFAPHAPYTPAPKYKNFAQNRHIAYPKTKAYNRLPKHALPWLKSRPKLSKGVQASLLGNYRKRIDADKSVDNMIGRLQNELKAKGLAKNTYFVFSSDNGYHMGEYQLRAGKQTAFDTDIHVPLVVTGPSVPHHRTVSKLTSNIDINPTFETLAGLTPPSTVDGHSLVNLLHGKKVSNWRQAILVEHHGPDDQAGDPDAQNAARADPPSYEAVRTANALYVQYANGEREYYRTGRDPDELNNIARRGVPSYLRHTLTAMENCHNSSACWAAAHF
jgi:N-acetylglucosamine-6-sulfatase